MRPDTQKPADSSATLIALWLLPVAMRSANLGALAVGGASLTGSAHSGLGEAIVNWDGHWYLGVAVSGYSYVPGTDSNVAFFPLFPLAMRYLGEAFAIGYVWAGVAVSLAASLLISPLIYALVSQSFGPKIGRRAAVTLALFPTAFFFTLPYPDAAFVAAVLASFYFASKDRWLAAALSGGVASGLKIFGVLVAPSLLWLALEKAEWRLEHFKRRAPLSAAVASLVSLFGAGAYCAFLWMRFGNPFAFYSAQLDGWPHQRSAIFVPVIETAGELLRPRAYLGGLRPDLYWAYLLDTFGVVATVAVMVAVIKRLEGSWIIFWVAATCLPLLAGTTNSFARYQLSFFPFFVGAALLLTNRWLRWAVWFLLGTSQLSFAYLFGKGWWVG